MAGNGARDAYQAVDGDTAVLERARGLETQEVGHRRVVARLRWSRIGRPADCAVAAPGPRRKSLSPLSVLQGSSSAEDSRVSCVVLPTQSHGARAKTQCTDKKGCTTMKSFAITAMTAGALVGAALGRAGAASAAPSGPSSLDDTISSLKANGYKVIVTRLSGGASSPCSV